MFNKYIWKGGYFMFKLSATELQAISLRMDSIPHIDSKKLEGFACSASDNSCGCGWDCSSTKT